MGAAVLVASGGCHLWLNVPCVFNDISGTGAVVLDNDAGNSAGVPVGFAFNCYGTAYSTVFVSTKGLLSFTSGSINGSNTSLSSRPCGMTGPPI